MGDLKVSTFCSVATESVINDLYSLILSLGYTNPGASLYIISDSITQEVISSLPTIGKIEIYWRIELNNFSGKNRKTMEIEGTFTDFLMFKSRAMEFALETEKSVMYLDSDIFIMSKIILENYDQQTLSLSRHHINERDENLYGVFNAGVVWTNSLDVPRLWREKTDGSRFYDQTPLEDLAASQVTHIMHEGQNLSWWRLFQGNETPAVLITKLSHTREGKITYKGKKVQFIHVHLNTEDDLERKFSHIVLNEIVNAKSLHLMLLLLQGIRLKWSVTLPKQVRPNPFFNHVGDTFRELVKL